MSEGKTMKLQYKITMIIAAVTTVLVLVLALFMSVTWYRSIQNQVAMDAMDQAIIIAENPEIKRNMVLENGYIAVNKAVENIHLKTGIQYLYIINSDGRYFANPLPDKLNEKYNPEELKMEMPDSPEFYYELTKDAMVEGYSPIYTDGIRSGTVVVGIFNGRVIQSMRGFAIQLLIFVFAAIGFGVLTAYGLSKNIKKSIYGLEPKEIAMLLKDKEIILENMGEGLMAVDDSAKVTLVNTKAKKLLGQENLKIGMCAHEIGFYNYFNTLGDDKKEIEWRADAATVLKIEAIPLGISSVRSGFLYRIEDMSLIREKAEQLTNMKQLTEALRMQNHEFMNKLHTISGLIQLESYDEALGYIEQISETRQAVITLLNDKIKVPVLSGLILAKYSKAAKHNIVLEIDGSSYLESLPVHLSEHEISSVLGNLLNNAIEALAGKRDGKIILSIYEQKREIVIKVKDNGPGVAGVSLDECLKKGFSTKGPDRGYGLDIVNEIIIQNGGRIIFVNDDGLSCTVSLPIELEDI